MVLAIVDTHTLIWYVADPHKLSRTTNAFFIRAEKGEGFIGVPTVSLGELWYLEERSRIPSGSIRRISDILDLSDTLFEVISFSREMASCVGQISRKLVPDPTDRMIAATALHLNLPLLTSDAKIRSLPNLRTIG